MPILLLADKFNLAGKEEAVTLCFAEKHDMENFVSFVQAYMRQNNALKSQCFWLYCCYPAYLDEVLVPAVDFLDENIINHMNRIIQGNLSPGQPEPKINYYTSSQGIRFHLENNQFPKRLSYSWVNQPSFAS